jgi:pimeloyl-ACP methyl ester carboxylesterase
MTKSGKEIRANLERFEPVALREQVTRSWDMEPHVKTEDEARELLAMQMPFHFATTTSEAYRQFTADDRTVYSPGVLAYFSANEYAIEFEDRLGEIRRPVLIVTGEHDRTCTPRAAQDLHAGIQGSELVIVPGAGHMAYVERPDVYLPAVRHFFARHQ